MTDKSEIDRLTKENGWLNFRLKQVEDINKGLMFKRDQYVILLCECFEAFEKLSHQNPLFGDLAIQIYELLYSHREVSKKEITL